MSEKPKILCVCDPSAAQPDLVRLNESFQVSIAPDSFSALAGLSRESFSGLFIASAYVEKALKNGCLQNEQILEGMPDGVVVLDSRNVVIWANERLRSWAENGNIVGKSFYTALRNPEIIGPNYTPLQSAMATGKPSGSRLQVGDRYFNIHAAPLDAGEERFLVVTVSDVTTEMDQQQKLEAIHRAGIDLAGLSAEELTKLNVDERISLVTSNILHHTQHLLHFDVVEIRLLDQDTCELTPLLAYGMDEEAARRVLYAQPHGNGVTGFVAATGKSYLCEDTTEDPLYLQGFKGARSSLTVPLMWQDQVIGTFNVESPEPRAFAESDLQFLEIFARNVAGSLNTLQLLVAQRANTALESVEAIHRAVALPVDEILNEAVHVLESYIGHSDDMAQRVQRILRNARKIKSVIHDVGKHMAPSVAVPITDFDARPKLVGKRVLVADADEAVRNDAHSLLERYGCVVETAHDGGEANCMARNSLSEAPYDVIIADIRLPDMNGYEFMMKLRQAMKTVPPLILMTGFGYDSGHSLVKARQAGLHPKAILYKPFRLEQLLETVETILDFHCSAGGHAQAT